MLTFAFTQRILLCSLNFHKIYYASKINDVSNANLCLQRQVKPFFFVFSILSYIPLMWRDELFDVINVFRSDKEICSKCKKLTFRRTWHPNNFNSSKVLFHNLQKSLLYVTNNYVRHTVFYITVYFLSNFIVTRIQIYNNVSQYEIFLPF